MQVSFRGMTEKSRKELRRACLDVDMSMSEAFRLFVRKVIRSEGKILIEWKSEEPQELNFE